MWPGGTPAGRPRYLVRSLSQVPYTGPRDRRVMLGEDLTSLLHGSAGLLSAYAVVQGGLLAGLIRGQAGVRRLMMSPLVAAPLTVVAGAGMAAAAGFASAFGITAGGVVKFCAGVVCSAALGY